MRIELRTSGGFAGVRRPPVVVETGDREDGAALEMLAEQVVAQAGAAPPEPSGADRFQYDLSLGDAAVRLHEGALSPEAAELIERVRTA